MFLPVKSGVEMNSTNSKTPNSRLRYECELRGWSQSKVASEVGTNTDRISRWESGESGVSPYYREKLCTLFGKTTAELGFLSDPQEEDVKIVSIPEESAPTPSAANLNSEGYQPIQLIVPPRAPVHVTIQVQQVSSPIAL